MWQPIAGRGPLSGRRALLLVENESVPQDGRVWNECRVLTAAGLEVTVACPLGERDDTAAFEMVDGVAIHRFEPHPASGGARGYVREYTRAIRKLRQLARTLSSEQSFDVVHAANPPDLLLPSVRSLKRAGSTRFIFDQHDLVPELYLSRFGKGRDLVYASLRRLEAVSYGLADVVISTNESYRRIAVQRGGKQPEDVFVVRNAPRLERFRPVPGDPRLKRGKPFLIAFVGLMSPQDHVDNAVRALALLRERRSDWHAVFAGNGDELDSLRRLSVELGLDEVIDFPGYLRESEVVRLLASSDVCLAPEPSSPLNDVSTLMKVAEYMAMSRPIVSFDLPESRFTAGSAAAYAKNGPESFAACIDELLDDPARRAEMGALGRKRIEEQFSWKHSEHALIAAYERVLRVGLDQNS